MARIAIAVNRSELEQVRLAARLRGVSVAEYVKRSINQQMLNDGVDAELIKPCRNVDDRIMPIGTSGGWGWR